MHEGGFWRERPIASRVLRAVVIVLAPAAAMVVGLSVGRLLPQPGGAGALAWWIVVFAASMTTLYQTERIARRLLSLSMLLRLSLLFPDRAPSRFAIALRSGSLRRLRHWATATDHENQEVSERLEGVLTLATALNTHDRRTRGHSERVRALTDLLADEMGIQGEAANQLRWGALLHDVGKLAVPASILNKAGAPDDREWSVLRRHPAEGERIAATIAPFLGDAAAAISCHHERWEGGGYPHDLRGEEIPLTARIVAVTDSFETMTALRSYKRPMTPTEARAELVNCAGKQFDPDVVRNFLSISLPKLNRTVGLLTWVAQIPFLGTMPRAAAQAVTGGSAVAAVSPQLVAAGAVVFGASTVPALTNDHSASVMSAAPVAATHLVDDASSTTSSEAATEYGYRGSGSVPHPTLSVAAGGRVVAPEDADVDASPAQSGRQSPASSAEESPAPVASDRADDSRRPDHAGPPNNIGTPETAGPPAHAGPPNNIGAPDTGPPDHAGPPQTAGPPDDAGPPETAGPPDDAEPPHNPGGGAPGGGKP